MSLSPDQIKLVRESFERLRPISGEVASAFFDRLFELDSTLRFLFHNNLREQGSKLMEAIGLVVEHLDRLPEVEPALQQLGIRHVAYGVKLSDYEVVGEALLWAIERNLMPRFPPETKDAWTEAYLTISTTMKSAALDDARRGIQG